MRTSSPIAMLTALAGLGATAIAACGDGGAPGARPPERPETTAFAPGPTVTASVDDGAPGSVDPSTFTGKQVRGRLPPEQIKTVVLQNVGVFRDCYEQARRTNPRLQGKVTVKFEIDPDGIVRRSADVRSDLPDTSVVECVVDAYRTLRFPKPSAGVVIVYFPLIFNPPG